MKAASWTTQDGIEFARLPGQRVKVRCWCYEDDDPRSHSRRSAQIFSTLDEAVEWATTHEHGCSRERADERRRRMQRRTSPKGDTATI